MTTIGYGDFYPNSDGARYVESADARHHQVYVWCMGAFPVYYTNYSSLFQSVESSWHCKHLCVRITYTLIQFHVFIHLFIHSLICGAGIIVIVVSLASFSFVFATVQDNILEQRDYQEQVRLTSTCSLATHFLIQI
eukprot:COSAG03_NODE_1018_length_5011_cov_2.960505_3_plen_136_part_00